MITVFCRYEFGVSLTHFPPPIVELDLDEPFRQAASNDTQTQFHTLFVGWFLLTQHLQRCSHWVSPRPSSPRYFHFLFFPITGLNIATCKQDDESTRKQSFSNLYPTGVNTRIPARILSQTAPTSHSPNALPFVPLLPGITAVPLLVLEYPSLEICIGLRSEDCQV